MIDTPYPYFGPAETNYAEFSVDLVLAKCPRDMREAVLRCMLWSTQDSVEWVARNSEQRDTDEGGIEADEPPPALLVWGKGYVPVTEHGKGEMNVAVCDFLRERKGGWDERFPHRFISAVWEVGAHHFGFFEGAKVSFWYTGEEEVLLTLW